MAYRGLRNSLLITTGLLSTAAGAQDASESALQGDDETRRSIEEINVVSRPYGVKNISNNPVKLPLLDLPRSVTVINDGLLMEQGRRSLRDSLRNVTGVTLDAGEGNPPGGADSVTIRGFAARDDVFVDGMRDVGLFFRDPFNVETIEVSKGPGSAISGRGNVGGTINLVERKAELVRSAEIEGSVGSDNFFRATTDVNEVLSREHGIAIRLNAMIHDADKPGREEVTRERWGFAPSIAYGLGTDTVLRLDYFHLEQDDRPDGGIPNARNPSLIGTPFSGLPAPVGRGAFFGHSTDKQDVTVDRVTASIDHRFNDSVSLDAQIRYGRTNVDAIITSPRFADGSLTTIDQTTQVVGNQKPRKQRDNILIARSNLNIDFDTAGVSHQAVVGIEGSTEESRNRRRLDANGPPTNLFNPQLRPADPIPFNGTSAETQTDVFAVYAFDTIEFTPQWFLSGGVRLDVVDTEAKSFDETGELPDFVIDLSRSDEEISGNIGLTFKPTPNSALFAAWGTSFETNARQEIVQLAGGNNNPPTTPDRFNVDPERTRAFEFGGKWDSLDGKLSLSASVFQIKKIDARTPGNDPGEPPVVLEGEQRSRGIELSAIGRILPNWQVFAGYTYLDSEVTKSNNLFEIGQDLPLAPEHSFTLWTSYQVLDRLSIGGGIQHMGSRNTAIMSNATGRQNTAVDDFTLVDLFVEYQLLENLSLRANLDNVTDKFYFQGANSGQSLPGPARAFRLSAIARF